MEDEAAVLFAAAAQYLFLMGYAPVNPMKLPHVHDKTWHSYMKECIKALCDCEVCYMLKNWKESPGAIVEWELARKLGLTILYE